MSQDKQNLTTASCMVGFVAAFYAFFWRDLPLLNACVLFPVVALLYALMGRFVSQPFCVFYDWAVGGNDTFSVHGVEIAVYWPLTLLFVVPVFVYGCIRRMF